MCNLVSDVNRKILGQYLHGCLAFKHCLQLYRKLSKKISNKKLQLCSCKLDKSSFLKYNIMKFIRNSNFFWSKLMSHLSFISLFQIQMFLEDLSDIVRELKRSDTYNSTYIPPSSS